MYRRIVLVAVTLAVIIGISLSAGQHKILAQTGSSINDFMPSVGPNGVILFSSTRGGENEDIYRLDKTGKPQFFVGTPDSDLFPAWNPSGNLVAWISCGQNTNACAIMVADSAGKNVRKIAADALPGSKISWIGNEVLYAAISKNKSEDLFAVNLSGTKRQITDTAGVDEEDPVFCPNKGSFVFAAKKQDERFWHLFFMKSDKREALYINLIGSLYQPAVTSDCRIAFVQNLGQVAVIHYQTLTGGVTYFVTNTQTATDAFPSWSADGKYLVYASVGEQGGRLYRRQVDSDKDPVCLTCTVAPKPTNTPIPTSTPEPSATPTSF